MFVDHNILLEAARIVGGEEAVRIVEMLSNAGEITDEQIVAETEIKLNDVRRILYKLYEHSIVGLRRTRDKKTGWFIFHWRLQPEQLEGFIINQKKKILTKLEARLEYERNNDFFHCGTSSCKLTPFDEAMEQVFRCQECNKPLVHYDNKKIIETLSDKIEELRNELGE
jgi:transcription initiation factor TFIIE subunit alpha